jgi:hypothetical protein
MRYLILVPFYLIFSFSLFAQKPKDTLDITKKHKPWKGLIFDVGVNQYTNAPYAPALSVSGSRGINIYHYFGIPFGCCKFTLAPGFGFGFDNYNFEDASVRLSTSGDSLIINSGNNGANIDYKKSKLSASYLDFPLELRFSTGKSLGKTFRIAIGGKAGILFNSHTKVKYTIDNNTKKEKLHDDFAIQNFRYGLTGRIGYGYLNLFGYYGLSDLFKKGKGPEAVPFMLGLTFSPSFLFDF